MKSHSGLMQKEFQVSSAVRGYKKFKRWSSRAKPEPPGVTHTIIQSLSSLRMILESCWISSCIWIPQYHVFHTWQWQQLSSDQNMTLASFPFFNMHTNESNWWKVFCLHNPRHNEYEKCCLWLFKFSHQNEYGNNLKNQSKIPTAPLFCFVLNWIHCLDHRLNIQRHKLLPEIFPFAFWFCTKLH